MELIQANSRKGEILIRAVDSYIHSAAPISSKYMTQQSGIKLSSATIRSIFSDLAADGYLVSPHCSSGRLPTAKAYRYYVDHLPPLRRPLARERRYVEREYLKRGLNLKDILTTTVHILSILTNNVAVAMSPLPGKKTIKHIELINMGADEVLVVIATRQGTVSSCKIFLEKHISEAALREVSRKINSLCKGLTLQEIRQTLDFWGGRVDIPHFSMVARTLCRHIKVIENEILMYKEGAEKVYIQIKKEHIPAISRFLASDMLQGIVRKTAEQNEMNILIATDDDSHFTGISMVCGSYRMGESTIGSVGVVGPNHMDYWRVMSLVEYVRRLVSNMITKMSR